MSFNVSITGCADYSEESVSSALERALAPLGGLDWVAPGMKIAIKVNLVASLRPDTAAVTHPAPVSALCRMLAERGASVVVGDSPGGLWSSAYVSAVYAVAGIKAVESAGAALNRDFSQKDVHFEAAHTAKDFPFTSWLDDADAVINFCKLKTHGLTAMSCAVKNLFGSIPGTRKPEFHYVYPKLVDFSNMLIDLNEYIKPRLTIVDAVMTMEGNGPTQGTPRYMGALVAADTTYNADLVCAHLIGFAPDQVSTITEAIKRKLCPASWRELSVCGDPEEFAIPDFIKQPANDTTEFRSTNKLISKFLASSFASVPLVDKAGCVGCGKCAEVCPMKTISLEDKKAIISRKGCIRCFCCQEFCPKGAISVHRPLLARVIGK